MQKVHRTSFGIYYTLEYKPSMSCSLLASSFSVSFSAAFRSRHSSVDWVRCLASLITLGLNAVSHFSSNLEAVSAPNSSRKSWFSCWSYMHANTSSQWSVYFSLLTCNQTKQWSQQKRNAQLTGPLTSKKRGNVLKTSWFSADHAPGPADVERSSSSSETHLLHQESEQEMK